MGTSCSKFCKKTKKKTQYKKEEHKEKNGRDHNKRTEEKQRPERGKGSKECVQPTQTENTESVRHFAINNGIKLELDKGDEENMKQNNYIPPNIGNNKEKENETGEKAKEKRKERKGEGKRRNDKKKRRRKKKKKHKYWSDSSDSSSLSSSSSSSSSDDDTGRTSKSRQKKIDKDGNVTYIKNKTTIGSSKISFKAAKNINIYNNGVITQPKTAATKKPASLFTTEYTSASACLKEEEFRNMLGQTGGAGQFIDLRGHENVQPVIETRSLCESSKWVGQIQFPKGHCTCFRVGSKYIMTTLHAVREILNTYNDFISVKRKPSSGLDCDLSVLSNSDVKIDFNFEVENQTSHDIHKFTFKRIQTEEEIPFLDEATDVIVLELDIKPGQVVPPNFTNFGIPKLDRSFTLITHSKGDPKAFDKVNKMVDISDPRTLEDIKYLRQHSSEYVSGNDQDPLIHGCETPPFNTLDNKNRLLFHCASGKGASGSPGVQVTSDGKVVVVTMLLHGYPDWYYDEKCKTLKNGWQKVYTVEQGVNFASVYTTMRDRNKRLCDDIFVGEACAFNKSLKVVQPTDAN